MTFHPGDIDEGPTGALANEPHTTPPTVPAPSPRRPSERVYRAAFAVVFVLLGGVAGFGITTIVAPAPRECTVMANTADRAFVAYENLATSTRLAVSRGRSEYDQHEADIAAAYEELGDLGPVYREAKAECLGAVR
jgi:hypothetical protein